MDLKSGDAQRCSWKEGNSSPGFKQPSGLLINHRLQIQHFFRRSMREDWACLFPPDSSLQLSSHLLAFSFTFNQRRRKSQENKLFIPRIASELASVLLT
ncbi:hypothetical protein CHARACLAT_022812 [Characodon lateralis]|uniref:Uncharacterized protein n=1 Tax=Characodon lateralis TaxID=208331 RepID=A0ABU7D973_9TELE|nr:hypothetical protein [Characodon lateralis]